MNNMVIRAFAHTSKSSQSYFFGKWYRFCAFSFLIYIYRASERGRPGRIPTERMNATGPANELSGSKGVLEGKGDRSAWINSPKSVSVQPDGMLGVDSLFPHSSSKQYCT